MIKTASAKDPGVCGGPLPVVRYDSTNIDILLGHFLHYQGVLDPRLFLNTCDHKRAGVA